jgi:predicted transcriptional regulator
VTVSHPEILKLLRQRCAGKQAALAHEAGVSEAYVSRVFAGDYPPSEKLLRLIGCRRVTAYERVDDA